MKSALTRAAALCTAYAVALQVMLALVGLAALTPPSSAEPIFCATGNGAPDHGGQAQEGHLCLAGCVMPCCGFAMGPASSSELWIAPAASDHLAPLHAAPAGAPDRPHASARAPPSA